MRLLVFTIAILALIAAYRYWPWRDVRYGPGVVAAEEPVQLDSSEPHFGKVGDYKVTRLAEYTITARVLSSRRYRYGDGHDLVPIDLALGWGRMSDESVLDTLEISQAFRFYFYQWRGHPTIPPEEMATHSANVHIIPAGPEVEHAVFGLPRGAVVRLTGDLVQARDTAGHTWTSSLTRNDTGAGACELMYVRSAERIYPPTRIAQ